MVLDELIVSYYFYILLTLLVTIIALLIKNFSTIKKQFSGIRRNVWILLIVIVLAGLLLRAYYVPTTHKLFDDEYAYQLVSKNFALEQKLCENLPERKAMISECVRPVWAPAWPFMMYISGMISADYFSPFYLNILIGSATTLIFFLISFLLTRKQYLSLLPAVMIAFLPTSLKFSSTVVSDISSLFFASCTFLLILIYLQAKKESLLLLVLVTALMTLQLKFENFIIVLGLVAFLLLNSKRPKFRKNPLLIFITILTVLVLIFHLSNTYFLLNTDRSHLDWMHDEEQREEHFKPNLDRNIDFFFKDERFPLGTTIISLIGLYAGLRKKQKTTIVMLVIFAAYFILYTNHGMGHFTTSESDRYLLNMFIPMIVFFTYGLSFLSEKLRDKKSVRLLLFAVTIYLIISAFQEPEYYFDKTAEQVEFDLARKASVEEGCIIFQDDISHALMVTGRDYYDISYLYKNPERFEEKCLLLYDNRIMSLEGFNPEKIYGIWNPEPYKETLNTYPEGKNPFLIIHIS